MQINLSVLSIKIKLRSILKEYFSLGCSKTAELYKLLKYQHVVVEKAIMELFNNSLTCENEKARYSNLALKCLTPIPIITSKINNTESQYTGYKKKLCLKKGQFFNAFNNKKSN